MFLVASTVFIYIIVYFFNVLKLFYLKISMFKLDVNVQALVMIIKIIF